MTERPHVLLSAAVSLDGYLDDASDTRLVLSNDEDWARVDGLRAESDAILVGANTVRADDPRLLVRSPELVAKRVAEGRPEQPVKVTLTRSGSLDPAAQFFTVGDAEKLVYAPPGVVTGVKATVVELSGLSEMLADLFARGVRRLMVEGGGAIHTQFLTEGLVDELHLAIAPFFVGDPRAPRFVGPGAFPRGLALVESTRLGDVAVLEYHATPEPSEVDILRLREAIALAENCPPRTFRVGAVITAADGEVISTGFSGDGDPANHAEEAALAKLEPGDPRLAEATMYTSLEPCSSRTSHPRSCTQLILDAGIPRVVFAWREPSVFVDCVGAETLEAAGRRVIEVPALAADVRRANTHIPGVHL
ncbi:5-amino-6-(5-phosphoribosylamino)uracil reductase [Amycolatopsis sp. WAC 04182]|uniref:dihydrofolate reductase family protein n=1 Tax=Amycolatopsis sp. WAC 04182 TaxID=2203198 RepID=UPI000F770282|nr:dihydrofolate reductase family protein [Amycolatopsis sp. WAC 04182]RSN56286.1 5-amino-6-(5-phosphoribosylamino)uracil reductase [Amycolatopsis sp. WAC 04182]